MANQCIHKVVSMREVIAGDYAILKWMCDWCEQEFHLAEEVVEDEK